MRFAIWLAVSRRQFMMKVFCDSEAYRWVQTSPGRSPSRYLAVVTGQGVTLGNDIMSRDAGVCRC